MNVNVRIVRQRVVFVAGNAGHWLLYVRRILEYSNRIHKVYVLPICVCLMSCSSKLSDT